MSKSKITASIIFALVLTNIISWKQNADLFAKLKDVDPDFVQEGVASWYGPGFHGHRTASGERFNTYEMTAAHKTLPFQSLVKITNLKNDKSVIVLINDRLHHKNKRLIDLSRTAAQKLSFISRGITRVKVEVLGKLKKKKRVPA